MDAALRAINLSKTFNGTPIVDNVSSRLRPARFSVSLAERCRQDYDYRLALQLIQPDAG